MYEPAAPPPTTRSAVVQTGEDKITIYLLSQQRIGDHPKGRRVLHRHQGLGHQWYHPQSELPRKHLKTDSVKKAEDDIGDADLSRSLQCSDPEKPKRG